MQHNYDLYHQLLHKPMKLWLIQKQKKKTNKKGDLNINEIELGYIEIDLSTFMKGNKKINDWYPINIIDDLKTDEQAELYISIYTANCLFTKEQVHNSGYVSISINKILLDHIPKSWFINKIDDNNVSSSNKKKKKR